MIETLRTGSWLTPARLHAYPAILLAGFSCALVYLLATSDGLMDRFDRPLGTDFSQVWVAGQEVLQGHPAMPYDNPAHAAMQRLVFGDKTQFYGWHYPPFFLGMAALLALLPYLWSLAAWQGVTLGLYLAVTGRIMAGPGGAVRWAGLAWLIPALAFPAVFVNLGHGHNGFLTAALLAGALLCLRRHPLLAGVMLGLLAYKPQFAVIVPVALLAGGYWRTLAAAAATVAIMVLATLAAFGHDTWQGFFTSLDFTRKIVLEQGSTGFEKIQTMFAGVRLTGGGIELAYAAQTLATLCTIAAIAWLWRSAADFRAKAAALLAATLLTTPYALDYDMMVLGPAIALMASLGLQRGFAPWERTLLALVWLVPLVARAAGGALHLPLGLLVTALFLAAICLRAYQHARGFEGSFARA